MKDFIYDLADDLNINKGTNTFLLVAKEVRYILFPSIPQVETIVYYRLSNLCWNKGHKKLSRYFSKKLTQKYGCYISGSAQIKGGLKLPHPIGIIIGEGVEIERNVTIYQNVTMGRKHLNVEEYPLIKSNATIYAGAVLIGNITIGEGTIIGANSVVNTNTEPYSIYCGAPAIRKGSENLKRSG